MTLTQSASDLLPRVTDAVLTLGLQETVPLDTLSLLDKVRDSLPSPAEQEFAGVDPYVVNTLRQGMSEAYRALSLDDGERVAELRVGLEQIRQSLASMIDGADAADERTSTQIAAWLVETLESTNQDIADLLGVVPRTLHRWMTGESTPSGDEAARLRIVARVVSHMRHALTGPGVLLWFGLVHPEIRTTPAELLDDPSHYPELVALAARARTHTAT